MNFGLSRKVAPNQEDIEGQNYKNPQKESSIYFV